MKKIIRVFLPFVLLTILFGYFVNYRIYGFFSSQLVVLPAEHAETPLLVLSKRSPVTIYLKNVSEEAEQSIKNAIKFYTKLTGLRFTIAPQVTDRTDIIISSETDEWSDLRPIVSAIYKLNKEELPALQDFFKPDKRQGFTCGQATLFLNTSKTMLSVNRINSNLSGDLLDSCFLDQLGMAISFSPVKTGDLWHYLVFGEFKGKKYRGDISTISKLHIKMLYSVATENNLSQKDMLDNYKSRMINPFYSVWLLSKL